MRPAALVVGPASPIVRLAWAACLLAAATLLVLHGVRIASVVGLRWWMPVAVLGAGWIADLVDDTGLHAVVDDPLDGAPVVDDRRDLVDVDDSEFHGGCSLFDVLRGDRVRMRAARALGEVREIR